MTKPSGFDRLKSKIVERCQGGEITDKEELLDYRKGVKAWAEINGFKDEHIRQAVNELMKNKEVKI